MQEIKKINKNYYKIYPEPFCSVFLDEELMRKVSKVLYKYKQEIDQLLINNADHTIDENGSLLYLNGKQKTFYGTNLKPAKRKAAKFEIKKVENLYFIGEMNIFSDEVENKIRELIELKN